jgi:hypothetical protein
MYNFIPLALSEAIKKVMVGPPDAGDVRMME